MFARGGSILAGTVRAKTVPAFTYSKASNMFRLSGRAAVSGKASRQKRRRVQKVPLVAEELEARVVPTLMGQPLFPADYPWNQDISNAPVAANSAAVIAHIGSAIRIHP